MHNNRGIVVSGGLYGDGKGYRKLRIYIYIHGSLRRFADLNSVAEIEKRNWLIEDESILLDKEKKSDKFFFFFINYCITHLKIKF